MLLEEFVQQASVFDFKGPPQNIHVLFGQVERDLSQKGRLVTEGWMDGSSG